MVFTFGGLFGHFLGFALPLIGNVLRVVNVLLQDILLVDDAGAAAGGAHLRRGRFILL